MFYYPLTGCLIGLYKGLIPKGKLICHSCDNPACINPKHLFAGTAKQNTDDMSMKGRGLYGRKPIILSNIITGKKLYFKCQREEYEKTELI